MKKIAIKILLAITFIFIVIAGCTIRDNNRFVLMEEEITINDLPDQLADFRILQISDLHEKQFGKNQRKLLAAINSIDYDVIVFTGDMLDEKNSTNYEHFYSFIDGIDNKEHALYVKGNTDPANYQIGSAIEKSDFVQGMEERGVKLLESIHSVSFGEANIHFLDLELSIIRDPQYIGMVEGIEKRDYMHDERYIENKKGLWNGLTEINNVKEEDVIIALNHYPLTDNRIEHIKENPSLTWRAYDLIISGHYHGGQIRFPFVGALFVPEPWYEPNSFFPPKDRVRGLWEYAGSKQYVSAGLGSSSAIPFLKFRLFNTPEINLITLTQ